MCIDDGRDVIFARDVLDEFVDKDRCLRVESRVRFIAEKIFGVESNGSGYGDPFLHAATYLRRILFVGPRKVYTFDTESGPFLSFSGGLPGKHFQWEHDVFENGERVE